MYKIKVLCETGNSFGSWEEEFILEYSWENLDVLKENIQRIKEHNDFLTKLSFNRADHKFLSPYKKKVWFVNKKDKYNQSLYDRAIYLKMDDGKEVQYSTYAWTGYFETLLEIEAIIDLPKVIA